MKWAAVIALCVLGVIEFIVRILVTLALFCTVLPAIIYVIAADDNDWDTPIWEVYLFGLARDIATGAK